MQTQTVVPGVGDCYSLGLGMKEVWPSGCHRTTSQDGIVETVSGAGDVLLEFVHGFLEYLKRLVGIDLIEVEKLVELHTARTNSIWGYSVPRLAGIHLLSRTRYMCEGILDCRSLR